MSVAEFDAGYHYAADLKSFARSLGIVVGNFRKHEVEDLIREYLSTGRIPTRRPAPSRKSGRPRDQLTPEVVVSNYVDDRMTKDFLRRIVHVGDPGLRDKSGQWYWLNDWRRQQQEAGARFTYRDLAEHLRTLMRTEGRLPQIPSARMNNFITDFRADPARAETPREEIIKAWMWLKQQPGPNTYVEYQRLSALES
jgi:hypothetical protein